MSAQHRLCDPGAEDCRQILIDHIRAETERLDVAFWFMEDSWMASEIIARWNAGVPVRILMDSEASIRNGRNRDRLAELAAAGIPMRERTTSGIMHWKMMLFAGQGLVEFSGANYSSDAWLPSGDPYTNYVDEVILFTSKASVVNSFKTKFDELWIDTVHYTDYANVPGPQSRVYPIYDKDPELNFPPLESYATRAVYHYYYETARVDVTMYRITDRRHADAMIDLRTAGVPIRLITEPQQYRDTTRLWHAWNVDRMHMAGVQIMHRAHAGLNHQKSVQLHGLGLAILGSSNWTSPSAHAQEEHNYFTTDRTIFDWLTAQFERKWNNTAGVTENVPFAPLPPDAPVDPLPAYESTGAFTHGLTLSWFGGPWAHSYDVYFGTNAGALSLIASRLPLGPSQKSWERQSFVLEQPLQPQTTYYWRVVGRTAAEMTTISPMWTFVTGAADTQSPTVSITAPTAGTTVGGAVTIAASASDNTVLSRVEFLVDGVVIGAATAAPYQAVWNTATVAAGSHTLQARAIDAAGNAALSSGVAVTVPDTTNPDVSLTAPASGATLRGEVRLEASATDDVAVSRVDFLAGGALVGSATASPYRVAWDAASHAEGTVTLTARAVDAAGNSATSAAITATVDHPDAPGPCTFGVVPSTLSVAAGASERTVSLTATPTDCDWTAVSGTPWLTIAAGTSGTGSGQVIVSIAANTTGPVRTGILTVAGQAVLISQDAASPNVSVSAATLRFGAAVSDGGFTAVTPPQTVRLTREGDGAISWTARALAPWITVTPAAGEGDAVLSIGVQHVPGMPSSGEVQGGVEIAVSGAANTPGPIAVTLGIRPTGTTNAPFGALETPAEAAANVTGAIAVTGWALDDVGVSAVRVYRNCVGHDPAGVCQQVLGEDLVFVGDGVFVEGARPDVESAFPDAPNARAAGWGLMVLTNMLPHLPERRGSGGQGEITLYAIATDAEHHQSLLGRRTISLNNDHASKPFGTIDTPANGAVASGVVANFGWALTPGTARIPLDGSTITVYIDGRPVSGVRYSLCRGTAPNPVAAGTCDDDIARLFPNYTNITTGTGSLGVALIDTRTLANGLHTIAWSVTDDQGRVAGIGSRFFRVSNVSSADGIVSAGRSALAIAADDGAVAPIVRDGLIRGRTGFRTTASWDVMEPDGDGTYHVRIAELGRLELAFGDAVTAGYVRVNGERRPLPAGSALERDQFTWAPGPGFVGAYELTFTTPTREIPVRVSIVAAETREGQIRSWIDTPSTGLVVERGFQVAGWALDLAAWNGTGIGAVHVWAIRRDSSERATFLGIAGLQGRRPDVAAHFGAQFERAGWGLTAAPLSPGGYTVVAYFWSGRTGRFEDARSVQVTIR
ncbi:MAG: Ig-like domain-containing protein [Vicinamibacterales bacterium]